MLAIIGPIFAFVFGLVVLGVCIAIIVAVLRLLILLAVAGAIAAAVGLGFSVAGADTGPAVLMGLLAFPLALWGLRRRGMRLNAARPAAAPASAPVPLAEPDADLGIAISYSGPAESASDAALGAAWDNLAAMVPLAHTAPLFAARSACVDLLHLAKASAIDLDVFACSAFIRRNVPELALRNANLWSHADAMGRAALSQGIVEDVERLGAYVCRELDRASAHDRRADRDGLAALRLHIAARTDG